MPKPPLVSGAKAVKALIRLGFATQRQRGSHVVMRRGSSVCVVPMHREIDPGTLRGLLRQAGVEVGDFAKAL